MNSKLRWFVVAMVALLALAGYSLAQAQASPASIAKGGKLYDKWWKVVPNAVEPKGDHPLWASQTTNTRTGPDTWRCKECHGWDYKGKDGAYGSGSHKTGFVGVYNAGAAKSKAELVAILKGSTNPKHDFSALIDADSLSSLADFLKEGLADDSKYINYQTKKPIGGNLEQGKQVFTSSCAPCHGADGTQLNFGSEKEPEYVGTIASDNPWEFLHKVMSGQPGAPMPSGFESGWAREKAVDVLTFAQTLPTGEEAPPTPAVLPKTGDTPLPYLPLAAAGGLALLTGVALLRWTRRIGS